VPTARCAFLKAERAEATPQRAVAEHEITPDAVGITALQPGQPDDATRERSP
jgi:hypothetical protein